MSPFMPREAVVLTPAPKENAMSSVTLAQATTIVDAALAKGRAMNFAPLTVAVLDAGGHLVALKRDDQSGIMRVEIASGKAWGSLGMGFGSRELFGRATKQPGFFTALASASNGRMIPVPGGVLIRNAQGGIIGAVGISGDISDNDEICAVAGIEAAGLVPETGTNRAIEQKKAKDRRLKGSQAQAIAGSRLDPWRMRAPPSRHARFWWDMP
jgi:uncharacterized protein GlcG (DUF336 family)